MPLPGGLVKHNLPSAIPGRSYLAEPLTFIHVINQVSTQALLGLGCWSMLGLVWDKDVEAVTILADVEGDEEPPLDDDWDHINM